MATARTNRRRDFPRTSVSESIDSGGAPTAAGERNYSDDPDEVAASPRTAGAQGVQIAGVNVAVDPLEQRLSLRERTRSTLAIALMTLLGVTILTALALAVLDVFYDATDPLASFVQGIFGPVVALVGTALGFYFAGRESSARR